MKYDITQPPRRAQKTTSAYPAIRKATEPPEALPNHMKRPGRGKWYLGCATGALIIVGILFTFSKLVIPWYTGVLNRWEYGAANVYYLRADIGRGVVSDIYTIPTQGNVIVLIVSGSKAPEMYPTRMQGSTGNTLVIATIADMN